MQKHEETVRPARTEALLHRVFAASLDVICSLDRDWRFRHVSPACFELWGFLPGELLGRPFLDRVHPEDRERTRAALQGVVRGVPTRSLENRILHKDGRGIPCLWSAGWSPAEDTLCCIARDLTSRLEVEAQRGAAIKELENFKRALDEHAIVAVTDARGRITYVNDKFCEISQYTREELLGQDHRIINSGYHSKDFFRHLWKTILSGQVWQGEIRNRAKDGTHYWVDSTLVPFLDTDGKPEKFVAIRADITERKNSEAAMLQAQKLESLGVLAGGIAHDFNNLLTGVMGYADLAALDLPPHNPARAHLEQIQQAAQKAAALTRQLLAYAGKGNCLFSEVDLNLVVQEITQLLSVNVSKKAEIRLELAPSLPPTLADPSQIHQVIMNLVTNASEAIGEDQRGTIAIRTGLQRMNESDAAGLESTLPLNPGDYVILEVKDSGCGMTTEVVRRIFDPFFTTKFTGRGLGLSAVLGILRRHLGSLEIHSDPGAGSTFKVYLPATAASASTAQKPPAAPWSDRGKLLVVDDEPFSRAVARTMGMSQGFSVLEAADGVEALAIFKQKHHELGLVLMDLTMPRLGGREAFLEMRAMDPSVPVILSSGYNEHEAVGDLADKGLAGFLPKPYQLDLFIETIRQVLERAGR